MPLTEHKILFAILLGMTILLVGGYVGATDPESVHVTDAAVDILLALLIVTLAAKLGGDLVERLGQPAVLGELIFGIIVGNLHLAGITWFEPFKSSLALEVLAEIGVVLLLFQVGLGTTVKEMMSVGLSSMTVALLGVVTPFFLGWGVSAWLLPGASVYVHIFVGATLTATSVGITARVIADLGKARTREARIILGAAVIDDILGLVILAVVVGIVSAASGTGQPASAAAAIGIIVKAVAFVLAAVILGKWILPAYFKLVFVLRIKGVLLSFSLLICFLLAYVAGKIGLAPIIGAFAAGLILEGVHYKDLAHDRGERDLEELLAPIAAFLVPIFFVRMGMLVQLEYFRRIDILFFAAILTIGAVIGKQACSLGVWRSRVNRWAVGVGMIPRGEVGLIFAGIGARMQIDGRPLVEPGIYAAIVIMVVLTTLITPPLLRPLMQRTKEMG